MFIDHAMRLWHISTCLCVVVLGGENGHRDEVLSAVSDIRVFTHVNKQFISIELAFEAVYVFLMWDGVPMAR